MARESKEYGYCRVYDDDSGHDGLEPDYTINSIWDADDLDLMAEEIAENYWSSHDGRECDWPLKFAIFDGDTFLGKFEVEVEHNPSFSAGAIV